MTVYGLDYRPAPYEPVGRLQRLLPLAGMEYRALFQRRVWGKLLILFCAVPAIVHTVIVLGFFGALSLGGDMAGRVREVGEQAPVRARMFVPIYRDFYLEQVVDHEQALFLLLLLTSFATARCVARDRASNALELYWTRGITPGGYFLAKWVGAFGLVALITVAAPLLQWLTGVLVADDWSFAADTGGFMPRVVLALLAFTALLTLPCALLSAIAPGANAATILWGILLGGSLMLAEALSELLRDELHSRLSLFDAAATVARWIAGSAGGDQGLGGACGLLGGILLVLGFLARRRLRMTEAIG